MRLKELSERVRHSLWFIPTVSVLLAAIAALGMVALSDVLGQTGADLPLVFGAGPDGARAMLQAIAGSVITVAGVTFSITIVALQLTSTQFSPRVLRNFLRDRSNQLVLGVFMGTYTYALLVLRSIRAEDELRGAAFVPGPAITGGLILAFVSLGMLIYFIHHISVRIQVTAIVAGVAADTLDTLTALSAWNDREEDRTWQAANRAMPSAGTPPSGALPPESQPLDAVPLAARESGYLQLLDIDDVVRAAVDNDGRIRILVSPGGWVQEHAPIATFEPLGEARPDREEIGGRIARACAVAEERSTQMDAAFGIQQLVDIAAKALSPGVNDPTTAMNCVDRLVQVLTAAGVVPDAPRAFSDNSGVVRLEVPFPGFDELVPLAFDQIRHYGGTTPAVAIHLARALSVLFSALPTERHPPLRAQARDLAEVAESMTLESERRRALAAIAPLVR